MAAPTSNQFVFASLEPSDITAMPSAIVASVASALDIPSTALISLASAAMASMATPTTTAGGVAASTVASNVVVAATGTLATTSAQPTAAFATPADPLMGSLEYHGVHPYNAACVLFFSIVGFILQVPIVYAHSGIAGPPNVPVLVMALFYLYLMLSTIIAACHWHSGDSTTWWNGAGWCDIDVRMSMAISVGVVATQCVINYNLLNMLRARPQLVYRYLAAKRILIELTCCLALPIINLAVSTFFMNARYFLTQDLGCSASMDSAVATIIVYLMWFPILGAVCLFTLIFIIVRFYKRGRRALETIQFFPNMNSAQLFHMIGFALTIGMILVPLSISTAVINFISMHETGVHAISWAHGKPEGWSRILKLTLLEIEAASGGIDSATTIINYITHYVNIAIAWLLFICYGTGSTAISSYKMLWHKLRASRDDTNDEPPAMVDYYPESVLSRSDSGSIKKAPLKISSSPRGSTHSYPAPPVRTTTETELTNMRKPRRGLGVFLSRGGNLTGARE